MRRYLLNRSMTLWTSVLIPLAALATLTASEPDPGTGIPASSEPLYLLTYDHGGLVLWGQDHFAERLRDAVSWLNKYPGFKIGLDNEAHTYDVLAEENPNLLAQIRAWLEEYRGRFGIGTCTYGQPLSTFINEESNVRQLVEAIRADERLFGRRPPIYLMSEHAMHSQIPQLLAGCGFQGAIMRTHFMMYGYNPVFDAPIGWWIGLDSSKIPTVPTYPGEGAAFGKTTVDNWILTRWPSKDTPKSLGDFRKDFGHIHPLLASRADDSGLRREALVRECQNTNDYRWLLLEEVLQNFPKPKAEFRTAPNDFVVRMPWGYCGNEIWNTSRRAETQVLTAERLAALELLCGGVDHEEDLQKAWKNLLVGQHHDIQICGLLADARQFLPASLEASASVRDNAMQFFASRMKGEGLLQVTAFNPSSWKRQQWLEAELSFPQRRDAKDIVVTSNGHTRPAVLLSAERYSGGSLMTARVAFPAELEGLSLAAFSLSAVNTNLLPEKDPSAEGLLVLTNADQICIVTPFHQTCLHPYGGLASLQDRRTGKQFLKARDRGAFFTGTIDGQMQNSHGRWVVSAVTKDAPSATAREYGFVGSIPYTFELTFHRDTPRLDGHVAFRLSGQKIGRVSSDPRDGSSAFVHEEKLRLKLFPDTGSTSIGVRDLPFAVAETTNRYVDGNYWTAVTDGQKGVALFNRGLMGSVREADGGFSVPLAFAMYYIWGTRMLNGEFAYDFAVYPFAGNWRSHDLHKLALEYNFPVVAVSGAPGNGTLGANVHLLDTGSANVLLSALFPEHGSLVARLFEYRGLGGEAMLTLRGRKPTIEAVDLLGQGPVPTDPAHLAFRPWQIQTLRVRP